MRLTFLGTGSAMPTGHRMQTGFLLHHDEDALLVDCGSGVLHALARTKVGYEGIDAVLLSHHHLDHVSDLLPLMTARWLAGEESLTIAGPPGTERLVSELLGVHEYMQDRIDLTLIDVDASVSLAGFNVDAMETRHSMQCFAYRLTPATDGMAEGALANPPSVVLSGDTEAFPELIEFADGATVLVHDCSFPDDVDVSNHPTPSSLADALADVDPTIDRLYLSHLYPHTEGRHEEMLATIESQYDGTVDVAEDGLTLQLGPRRVD